LNGLVGGKPATSSGGSIAESSRTGGLAPGRETKKVATAEDRKRQMAQLAAMGIAIPNEYRKDVAMKGEWQVVATHPAGGSGVKKEEEKNLDALAKGVRKRKADDPLDEEFGHLKTRKGWGSDIKSYPGTSADINLDDLLKEPIILKQDEVKKESSPDPTPLDEDHDSILAGTKANDSTEMPQKLGPAEALAEETPATGIVFKKRKKQVREK
jgi:hypothetical protein